MFIKGERYKEKVQRSGSTLVEFEDGEVFDSSAVKSSGPPGPKKPGTDVEQTLDLPILSRAI